MQLKLLEKKIFRDLRHVALLIGLPKGWVLVYRNVCYASYSFVCVSSSKANLSQGNAPNSLNLKLCSC